MGYLLIFIGIWIITTIFLQVVRMVVGISDRGLGPDFIVALAATIAGGIEYIAILLAQGKAEAHPLIPFALVVVSFFITYFFVSSTYRVQWTYGILVSVILLGFYGLVGITLFNSLLA